MVYWVEVSCQKAQKSIDQRSNDGRKLLTKHQCEPYNQYCYSETEPYQGIKQQF